MSNDLEMNEKKPTNYDKYIIAEEVRKRVLVYSGLFFIAGGLGIFAFLSTVEVRIRDSVVGSLSEHTRSQQDILLADLANARLAVSNADLEAQKALALINDVQTRMKSADLDIDRAEGFAKTVSESISEITDYLLEKDPTFKNEIVKSLRAQLNKGAQWTDIVLENGWVAYLGSYMKPRYVLDAAGVVHLFGTVKSGTGNIFTLPQGMRPSERLVFDVATHPNNFARIDIDSAGNVMPLIYHSGWLSLNGISFIPEQ